MMDAKWEESQVADMGGDRKAAAKLRYAENAKGVAGAVYRLFDPGVKSKKSIEDKAICKFGGDPGKYTLRARVVACVRPTACTTGLC